LTNQWISVQIELNSRQYRVSDPQILEFTISNNSKEKLSLLKWNTPLEGINSDMFNIRRVEDGEKAVYLGRMVKRGPPKPEDYVTLEPNESISTDFDLAVVYDIAMSGIYTVEFVTSILDVGTEEPEILVTRMAETRGFKIQSISSNIIEFNLLEERNPRQSNGIALGWNERGEVAAEIVAPIYKQCTISKRNVLLDALGEAEHMSCEAKTFLSTTRLELRPNAFRYKEWFGRYDGQRFNAVNNDFDKIVDVLANKRITLNCDCNEDHYAHVFPTRPYEIFLCNRFWTAPLTGTDSQAGTIIHELSHFNVVAGTDDNAYGQVACRQLAIDNPSRAIDNADSHEYFAENTPLLYMIPKFLIAVGFPNRQVHLFVRGTDNVLYHMWTTDPDPSHWNPDGWMALGQQLPFAGDPAALSFPNGDIHLFVRRTDNVLYHMWSLPDPPFWSNNGQWHRQGEEMP
jgi:peptidyl-Lys metalloendopeptidase